MASPPPAPTEEPVGKDASERREGRPDRPKREYEEIPEMTVEEAHKALNALPKVKKLSIYIYIPQQVCAISLTPVCYPAVVVFVLLSTPVLQ